MTLPDLLEEFNVVIDTAEGLNELRSLILGLAVRGKLVPQDSNDEPASELLKKVEAEKERLYEEGEIREILKLDSVDNSDIPFEIPNNWIWSKIGTFSYLEMGQSPSSDTYNEAEEGLPFYQGKTDFGDVYPTPTTWCSEPNKISLPGDILISVRAPVGPTNICEDKSCIGRGIAAIRPIADTNTHLLLYFMRAFEERIKENQTGSTFKAINKRNLSNFYFPLPPLAEQHRLVQKIESLFAEVDELEEKLNRQTKLDEKLQMAVNADVQQAPDAEASSFAWNFITSNFDTLYHTPEAIDNLKKNILNEAVRGRLVPQNPSDEPASELLKKIEAEKQRLYDEGEIRKPKKLPPVEEEKIPFQIPESWEWVRVETVGITQTGTTPKTSNSEFYGDYIPFVGPGDMSIDEIDYSNNGLSEKGMKVGRLIPKGSILMVCIGGSIGKCHIVNRDVSCNQQINTIFPIAGISSHYIKSVFRSDYFQRAILSKSTGSATPIINRTKWGNIPISLSPLEEQHRIVQRIEELFAICDRFKVQLEQRQKVNERLVKGLVSEVLEKAGSSEKELVKEKEILIAAEPEVEYSNQQLSFFQILCIAHALYVLKKRDMLQGEMGLAKYVYLMDRIGGIKTHFNFEQNNFGPYPSNFKKRLFTRSKYFYKSGFKDYEVIDLTTKSDRLFVKETEQTDQMVKVMENLTSVFKPYRKDRAHKLELMASVCWLIEKTKATDFDAIWKELDEWKTPKRDDVDIKAELFTKEEVENCLGFILKNGWNKKLVTYK